MIFYPVDNFVVLYFRQYHKISIRKEKLSRFACLNFLLSYILFKPFFTGLVHFLAMQVLPTSVIIFCYKSCECVL